MFPRIAIVGRPNVGKSTLFNRLAGRRVALVAETAGVTRDVREAEARIADLAFTAIDTPGLEEAPEEALEGRMRLKAEAALDGVDLVLFVVDARDGVTPKDRHFAAFLRRRGTPVVLVANKSEGRAGIPGIGEAYGLGFGDPVPVSAEHGEGLADLYQAIRAALPAAADAEGESAAEDEAERPAGPLRLAVVGRPNVGKSTLVNALIGRERMLTGPEPGLTREAIPVDWEWQGRSVRLVDTAGLRKRGKIGEGLERLSAADTLRAIRLAEVAVLTIDATQPVEHQDLSIARIAVEEGRALVIAANKWDAVDNPNRVAHRIQNRIEDSLPQVAGVAVVRLSARTSENLDRLMEEVFKAVARWNRRLATARLNRWLAEVLERHAPPALKGRRLKIRYVAQVAARPPTFALFGSRVKELPDDYLRYLVGGLRETFGLGGAPIRLSLREGDNPYEPKGRR
ncbi:MAG TPA: ribosome biogenesis GTPase Der [Alphaproteobacteria bacterium]|nr:ribosome biogenesis GTPase Der [Alphaproteobacteria bacterium]